MIRGQHIVLLLFDNNIFCDKYLRKPSLIPLCRLCRILVHCYLIWSKSERANLLYTIWLCFMNVCQVNDPFTRFLSEDIHHRDSVGWKKFYGHLNVAVTFLGYRLHVMDLNIKRDLVPRKIKVKTCFFACLKCGWRDKFRYTISQSIYRCRSYSLHLIQFS